MFFLSMLARARAPAVDRFLRVARTRIARIISMTGNGSFPRAAHRVRDFNEFIEQYRAARSSALIRYLRICILFRPITVRQLKPLWRIFETQTIPCRIVGIIRITLRCALLSCGLYRCCAIHCCSRINTLPRGGPREPRIARASRATMRR